MEVRFRCAGTVDSLYYLPTEPGKLFSLFAKLSKLAAGYLTDTRLESVRKTNV